MEPTERFEQDREQLAVGDWPNPFDEEVSCSHEWPDGTPARKFDLAGCWLDCAICGDHISDLNPLLSKELREPRAQEVV